MTPRHARRSRVPFGWLLIALGIAVGIAAYLVGRADDDAGAEGPPRTAVASESIPTPTPSEEPEPSPSPPADPKEQLVIHGTGDVSLDPSYIPAFQSNGYGWAWSGLDGLFRRDDLTVINHECPSTDIVAPLSKTFVFRCDPNALDEAVEAGIEVASLANNHGFDHGPEALLDSVRNLRRAGIVPIGAGASQEEADAPAYVEVGGWRIGLVGVGEVIDPETQVAVGDEIGTAVGHDFPRAIRAIEEAEENADLVIVVDPLGRRARHAAARVPGRRGPPHDRGGGRRDLRPPRAPAPADGHLPGTTHLLRARQLRVAELLGGGLHDGGRARARPAERDHLRAAPPGHDRLGRPPGPELTTAF